MTRFAATATSLLLSLAACGGDKATPKDTVGANAGGVSCRNDGDCAGLQLTPCKVASCDRAQRRCVIGAEPDGSACATGAPCVEHQSCLGGTCGGGNALAKDCGEKQCGADSCGNSCGSCQGGAVCTAQLKCEVPVDTCQGMDFEGCCTAAGMTRWCDENGVVQELDCPTLNSQGENLGPSCGWIFDQAYYYCTFGSPAAAPTSANPYLCPGETCPQEPCAGRACGWACGHSCGTCPGADDYCTADGKCEANACGNLAFVGCCAGSYSVYCSDNQVIATNCASGAPPSCGWDTANDWYDCGLVGADPAGGAAQDCGQYEFPRPPELPAADPGPDPIPDEAVVEAAPDASAAGVVEDAPDTSGR